MAAFGQSLRCCRLSLLKAKGDHKWDQHKILGSAAGGQVSAGRLARRRSDARGPGAARDRRGSAGSSLILVAAAPPSNVSPAPRASPASANSANSPAPSVTSASRKISACLPIVLNTFPQLVFVLGQGSPVAITRQSSPNGSEKLRRLYRDAAISKRLTSEWSAHEALFLLS